MSGKGRGEIVMEVSQYLGQRVLIRLSGGREVIGTMIGCDRVQNVVLDDAKEVHGPIAAPNNSFKLREFGLCVVRGSQIVFIAPEDGLVQIENPWA